MSPFALLVDGGMMLDLSPTLSGSLDRDDASGCFVPPLADSQLIADFIHSGSPTGLRRRVRISA